VSRASIPVEALIPYGIKPEDHWHIRTTDDTCSRCREPIPEDDVPLLLWRNGGHDMLAYCEGCLGTREESRLQRAFDAEHD
jgi:hypothetical protein